MPDFWDSWGLLVTKILSYVVVCMFIYEPVEHSWLAPAFLDGVKGLHRRVPLSGSVNEVKRD